jgi:hypothetical protein
MRNLTALLAGLLFGLGLIVSGMADPARVLGFFDLFGAWDPTLAFVLAGAVAVSFVGWQIAGRRRTALLGGPLPGRPLGAIDARLIGGGVLFGAGWALAGICPGPSVVGLMTGRWEFWLFFAAMLAGMGAWNVWSMRLRPAA